MSMFRMNRYYSSLKYCTKCYCEVGTVITFDSIGRQYHDLQGRGGLEASIVHVKEIVIVVVTVQ